jgi:siroheme synthase
VSTPLQQSGSVHVFGLGMRMVTQVTLESNYLLQQMELIFHLEDGPEVSEYIKSLGCAEVSLRHLYAEGKPRTQVYQAISDAIMEAASGGAKCAYLTPGNPAFLNNIVFKLRDSARQFGIPFIVYPGVSSLDTFLTDLMLPIEAFGLQCYEATHFVRARPQIDKRVPLLLFQPSVVGVTEVRYLTGVSVPGVKELQDVLVELYESDQTWILWRSPMSKDDSPIVANGVLSELVEKAVYLELGTLLLPGEWKSDFNA